MEDYLISQAQYGDKESLAQLLYENYDFVFRYMVKFTFNTYLAEEITQETMVRAIEKIELYNPESSKFSTWLITIAHNIYMDFLRKEKREKSHIDNNDLFQQVDGIPDAHDDSINEILEALAKLQDDSRFPLLLKHYYGYSYEEIAAIMSVPLGTVKSRIHNALRTLRKELE